VGTIETYRFALPYVVEAIVMPRRIRDSEGVASGQLLSEHQIMLGGPHLPPGGRCGGQRGGSGTVGPDDMRSGWPREAGNVRFAGAVSCM